MSEELTSDVITMITETETAAINYTLDVNGMACPGPVLASWSQLVAEGLNETMQKCMVSVVSGQTSPDVMRTAVCDYLVLAFRVGYEVGRQRLEVPPCQEH